MRSLYQVLEQWSGLIRMGVTKILLGVAFPVFVGGGIALTSGDATPPAFWIARLCFVAAATDTFGLALYWLWTRNGKVWLRLIVAGVVGAIVLSALVFALRQIDHREARHATKLAAGNMPTPALPTAARVPQDALMIFLGSNIAWTTRMPHTVVEMGSDRMLAIDRDASGDGLVVVDWSMFDDKNNIIARIDKNGFWTASSTRITRPDPGTLIVLDSGGAEVLRIAFLNPKALSITGVFRHARLRTVSITPEYLDIGGMRVMQSVLGENARADIGLGGQQRRKANRESDD